MFKLSLDTILLHYLEFYEFEPNETNNFSLKISERATSKSMSALSLRTLCYLQGHKRLCPVQLRTKLRRLTTSLPTRMREQFRVPKSFGLP